MRRRFTVGLTFLVLGVILIAAYFLLPRIIGEIVYPLRYAEEIRECAGQFNLSPALLAAVVKKESNFNPNALSPAGATGLGQLMPGTAQGINARVFHYPSYDIRDPKTNLCFAASHLAGLMGRYNGDVVLSLAAYNGGGGVGDRLAVSGSASIPRETAYYIKSVPELYKIYSTLYGEDLNRPYGSPFTQNPPPPQTFWQRLVTDSIEQFLY